MRLDYPDFEVIVLPDSSPKSPLHPEARIVPTGSVRPSMKRNLGIANSKGDICAFIDSDAFPSVDWLKNAVKYFDDPKVAAIGGPGITPKDNSLMQKAGGEILSSLLGSGSVRIRYKPVGVAKEIDDWPTSNLICRRSVLNEVGNFSVDYWPGEDTKLCSDIVDRGYKILYAPDVVVYHHRRPLFAQHLRQIWQYGLHRGHFARIFPKTSRRPIYFLPTALVVGFIVGLALVPFFTPWRFIFLGLIITYLLAVMITGLKTKKLKMALAVFLGTMLTHLVYGIAFLRGLISRRLEAL